MAQYFVNFHANQRVRTHPLYLPCERCKTIEVVPSVIGKIDRNHIRLILMRGSESTELKSRKQIATLFWAHCAHHHFCGLLPDTRRCKTLSLPRGQVVVSERCAIVSVTISTKTLR